MNLRLSTCDCKVTKKRVKCKRKACFSFHFRVQSKFGEAKGKEKVLIIKLFKEKRVLLTKRALFRRGDRTRTCDSLVPNQERYQLRYTSFLRLQRYTFFVTLANFSAIIL